MLSVDHIWLQYITSLLGGTLLQELVVNLDVWYVAFVAWNDRRLLPDRALKGKKKLVSEGFRQ